MRDKFVFNLIGNRKAQMGETITWIVATIIILVVLFLSVFATNFYLNNRKDAGYLKSADTLASKSFFSYLLTHRENDTLIYEQLKSEGDFNEFNGNLAQSVFNDLYSKDYQEIWLGFSDPNLNIIGETRNARQNEYFGHKPKTYAVGPGGSSAIRDSVSILVDINKNSSIELFFVGRVR